MMSTQPARRGRTRNDQGSAMIMTLMALAILTALATTVATLTINNLQSSWRAQTAGSALNAADAGVAQAMTYLRNNGVRGLSCSPSCATNPWGNRTTPTSLTLPGSSQQKHRTWIEVVNGYPASDPGLYRIHATGTAPGSASRSVTVEVQVTTTDVPRGVFARSISGGGSATVTRQSVFSTGCVFDRSKIAMVKGELDLAYGIPIGVHSAQYITESNGSGEFCPDTDNKLIHASGPCSTQYPYDHDLLGGSLAGTDCASVATSHPKYFGTRDLNGDGVIDMNGSWIKDGETLLKLFNIKSPALSQAQIDQLRTVSQWQGNYWTKASGWSSPDEDQAVMFFDLAAENLGGTVDLNDVTGFSRDPNLTASHPSCTPKSLVIVVEGGNVRLNSNQQLAASLFLTSSAPYGQVLKANGKSVFIGTIYADTVNLVGNADISTDPCFVTNASPALLDLQMGTYREEDRSLS